MVAVDGDYFKLFILYVIDADAVFCIINTRFLTFGIRDKIILLLDSCNKRDIVMVFMLISY